MSDLKQRVRREGERGFSAVEALVSVVVLSLIVLFAVTMFQSSSKISKSASIQGDSQQSARVAVDLITKDLRSLGFDIDLGGGQQGLVHAGPWDVVFNANVTPGQDDPMAPAEPSAIDVALAPAAVPASGALYAPAASFGTGAETIRYTLDSNGDGAVDNADVGDDAEEATPNPNDFVLRKEIYGERADGTNGGAGEPVAIVRGPLPDQDGNVPPPLFQYWLDHDDDDSTPEVLHGDGDGDGQLSTSEIAALTPVPANQLALVTRSVIAVTAEDGESQGRADYRTRQLFSSVTFRNFIRRTAVIAGIVYQDTDADGEYDSADEVGIANVTVRLNSGDVTLTSGTGAYVFETDPGVYTVTELDPPGYSSTTPNAISVTASTGATSTVHFGDRPGGGVGQISGTVYFDENQSGALNGGERGIENVIITLHTGLMDTTNAEGQYSFELPVATYTVVETDSTGWASTTPNAVEVILSTNGQHEIVDFGDIPAVATGTIHGIVYLDADEDGTQDPGESGIADVPIAVAGEDSTVTDGNGQFTFTVPAGIHSIREYDLAGYSSSTPNLLWRAVVPDSTVEVSFGDIFMGSTGFTVVAIGTTDRALSVTATDLVEDSKGDPDIILGTQVTSGANLRVWHNKRVNSGTPITALFNAAPTFSRTAGGPIPALLRLDINADGVMDLLTGLDLTAASNLKLWQTITSGSGKGTYPSSPNYTYEATAGSAVTCFGELYWPGMTARLILVGTRTSSGGGRVEIWRQAGGTMTHLSSADLTADAIGGLSPITAITPGDFDSDGYTDLAVAQDLGSNTGRVSIFRAQTNASPDWDAGPSFTPDGAPLSLAAIDMAEDDQNDIDLIVGTSKGTGAGRIELWSNTSGDLGGAGPAPSDWVDSQGEVLCLAVTKIDRDVFPDVIAGLRTASYAGRVDVYRTFGYLPSSGTTWSSTACGEVVTSTVNDFNIDGLKDVAVGTRKTSSTGELIVYFGS